MITTDIPKRCLHCGRYCDSCSFGRSRGEPVVVDPDPLDTARGIVNGLALSLLMWASLIGFALLIYFNVHA